MPSDEVKPLTEREEQIQILADCLMQTNILPSVGTCLLELLTTIRSLREQLTDCNDSWRRAIKGAMDAHPYGGDAAHNALKKLLEKP